MGTEKWEMADPRYIKYNVILFKSTNKYNSKAYEKNNPEMTGSPILTCAGQEMAAELPRVRAYLVLWFTLSIS